MHQTSLTEIAQSILDKTNGGLDIIHAIYPQANTRTHFKLREEKTASCSMKQVEGGVYIVKDFGSNDKAQNGIKLHAEHHGLEYHEAVLQLAKAYNIQTGIATVKNEAKFKKIDLSAWDKQQQFDENNFCFETKEFTPAELKVLGPFVTEKTCQKYKVFSLLWYAVKKESKITLVEATDTFPMFIFCFKDELGKSFYKIMQPKSEDKKYRFFLERKKTA